MRKLVCLLAVAMFAAPAFGGDITFTVYDDTGTDGQFRIGYSVDDPCDLSAMALWVTLSGSCTGTVENLANVVSTSSQFPVHIDYASDDPCSYTIGMGGQHPLADPCQAGTPSGPLSFFSIVMGRLDPCDPPDPPPATMSNLVTIDVDFSSDCTLNVDIEADNLRGGVVGGPFGSVTMVDGTVTQATSSGLDRPACWDTATQCHGDVTGPSAVQDQFTDTWDWSEYRDGFNTCYNNGGAEQATYIAFVCADYDHNGIIDTSDWPAFRDNFNKAVASDCPGGGTWPPTFVCP